MYSWRVRSIASYSRLTCWIGPLGDLAVQECSAAPPAAADQVEMADSGVRGPTARPVKRRS